MGGEDVNIPFLLVHYSCNLTLPTRIGLAARCFHIRKPAWQVTGDEWLNQAIETQCGVVVPCCFSRTSKSGNTTLVTLTRLRSHPCLIRAPLCTFNSPISRRSRGSLEVDLGLIPLTHDAHLSPPLSATHIPHFWPTFLLQVH